MTALALVPDAAEAAELFTGEVHPYADRWPMRTDDELDSMAASINARGQRFPCVLTPSGVLVDGRNRLAACDLADVPPAFVVDESLTDEDAIVAYIWDVNGDRRDMSKGQKAMLAALAGGRTDLLSKSIEASSALVAKAKTVAQWCDEAVIAAVIDGTTALNDAYAEAQKIKTTVQAEEIAKRKAVAEAKARAEAEAARLADLRKRDADLAALVDEGRMTLAEAVAAHNERTRKQREAEAAREHGIRQANRVVTEAVFRLSLFPAHPENLRVWLATYDPAHAIHPIDRRMVSDAIAALNDLLEAL